jgi:predicted NAD/FAD-dependent oxidoreductase
MTDARVGVVGAGAAGAAASYVLDAVAPDAEGTILEKSDVVCGRGATRERHGCVYDYGANYVKSDDERVNDLLTDELDADGLVDATEPIHVFDGSGTVSEGRDADDHKWTYRAGISDLARRLLDRTDATVRHGARVTALARDATTETWRATTTDGAHGPFDAVLLTPPAPQTAALMGRPTGTARRARPSPTGPPRSTTGRSGRPSVTTRSRSTGRTTPSSTSTTTTTSAGSPARSANPATSRTANPCS